MPVGRVSLLAVTPPNPKSGTVARYVILAVIQAAGTILVIVSGFQSLLGGSAAFGLVILLVGFVMGGVFWLVNRARFVSLRGGQ